MPTIDDNDVSAYSGKRRPGYERLMADVTAGAVDLVVAWHRRWPADVRQAAAVRWALCP